MRKPTNLAQPTLTRFVRNAVTCVAVFCALMATVPIISQRAYAESDGVVGQEGLPLVCDKEALRCTIVKTQCMVHWADGFTYEQWSRFRQDEIERRKVMCIARLMLGDKRKYEKWSKATDEGRTLGPPDPRIAEEKEREAEAIQQEQQDHLAQERERSLPWHLRGPLDQTSQDQPNMSPLNSVSALGAKQSLRSRHDFA